MARLCFCLHIGLVTVLYTYCSNDTRFVSLVEIQRPSMLALMVDLFWMEPYIFHHLPYRMSLPAQTVEPPGGRHLTRRAAIS